MKSLVKLLTVAMGFVAALVILQIPCKASAATTHTIRWDVGTGAWYISPDGKNWSGYYDGIKDFQDGDSIVFDDCGTGNTVEAHVTVRVAEVASVNTTIGKVFASSVDHGYACNTATLIVNCDAAKITAYPASIVQVNGNVGQMVCDYGGDRKTCGQFRMGVTGTVGSMNVYIDADPWNQTTVYNITGSKIEFNYENTFKTDAKYYSLTPTGNQGTTTQATPNGNQLDAVPKTGVKFNGMYLIMFAFSGLFLVGAVTSNILIDKK